MSDPDEPETFERSLAALEAIVRRLEDGTVDLEEAVDLFEQGRGHLAACRERLAVVQQRIEELTAADLPAEADEDDGPFPGADAG